MRSYFLSFLFLWGVLLEGKALPPQVRSHSVCYGLQTQGYISGTGACSHIKATLNQDGSPCGFTCQDVNGNALLTWSESIIDTPVEIEYAPSRVLNYHSGHLSIRSNVRALSSSLAFIADSMDVSGSIRASDVLLVGTKTTAEELANTLLVEQTFVAEDTGEIYLGSSANVITDNNYMQVAGSAIYNHGIIKGSCYIWTQGEYWGASTSLKVGSKLSLSWDFIEWLEGEYSSSNKSQVIVNSGDLSGCDVSLQSNRSSGIYTSLYNKGRVYAPGGLIFTTGKAGLRYADGSYAAKSFGIDFSGILKSDYILIENFYVEIPEGAENVGRGFVLYEAADFNASQTAIGSFTYLSPYSKSNKIPSKN